MVSVSFFLVRGTSVESRSVVGAATVVIGTAVVSTGTGQPSFSEFAASVRPSEQQPNNELSHKAGGQSFFFLLKAGVTLSGQHPNLVSLHVLGVGHPSSNGPFAAVLLSTAQHPNSVNMQGMVFGFTRHLRGFCSRLIIVESFEAGVVFWSSKVLSLVVLSSISFVVLVSSVDRVVEISSVIVESVETSEDEVVKVVVESGVLLLSEMDSVEVVKVVVESGVLLLSDTDLVEPFSVLESVISDSLLISSVVEVDPMSDKEDVGKLVEVLSEESVLVLSEEVVVSELVDVSIRD